MKSFFWERCCFWKFWFARREGSGQLFSILKQVVKHRRTGQHPFGGSNRVLPEWQTQIVCHAAPSGRKNHNELLQCLVFDGRRVVPNERLFCYHTRNVSQVDEYLFRSATQLVKQNCVVFARINVPDPLSRTPM